MRTLLLAGVLLLLSSPAFAGANSTAAKASTTATAPSVPRVIEPGVRLGPVTAASTLDNLRAALGKRNVSLEMVLSDDGKGKVSGAVLYPGDAKKRIELAWDDTLTKSRPRWARVRNASTWWHTPAGVRVGTSLRDLEKLNGRAFTVSSFRSGERRSLVRSWNRGNLAEEMEKKAHVWLAVPSATTKSQMVPLSQGSSLPSGDPPLRRLNPHVTEIATKFEAS
jgi:hypothetical protein